MITDALNQEAAQLEAEIASLDVKVRRLNLIKQLLKTYGSDVNQRPLFEKTENEAGQPYALPLTEAVLKFLRNRPLQSFTPREIRNEIRRGGFNSASPNLLVMITSVCNRKSESGGPFVKTDKGGVAAYAWGVAQEAIAKS